MYQFHDSINILIKPTDDCNLRCTYCFHRKQKYEKNIMPLTTLEHLYEIVFPHYKRIKMIWHGGEPTCAGADFYKKAFAMQTKYMNEFKVNVKNSMQTNGTLLSQELIDIFKENHVNIGISYDGIINDHTRGSTNDVNLGRILLQKNHMDAGIITVVNGLNINRLIENYEVMKKEKRHVQLNHYVETDPDHPNLELKLDLKTYIEKMWELFEYWIDDTYCNIELQPFTQMIREYLFKVPIVCDRTSCHRSWFSVNHSGKISPCDKNFPDKYTFGYVSEYKDIREMYESPGFKNLLNDVIERREICMNTCEIYKYCEGGCTYNAMVENDIRTPGGFSCLARKDLFSKIFHFLEKKNLNKTNYAEKLKNPILIETLQKDDKNQK